METGVDPVGQVFCDRYPTKKIEYFCKTCQRLVCARCMFETCNGHELAELDEVTINVRKNISDLRQLMDSTRTINDDNVSFVGHKRDEVLRMKEQQLAYIEYGFGEVIKKLEERRDQLKIDFANRYDEEEAIFNKKLEVLDVYSRDQQSIEAIYEDLQRFQERGSDAKVLTKIVDISEFIQKSILNLEHISKAKGFDKDDCQINPGLKPLSLHVQKVFELITKFNMFPPGTPGSAQQQMGIRGGNTQSAPHIETQDQQPPQM